MALNHTTALDELRGRLETIDSSIKRIRTETEEYEKRIRVNNDSLRQVLRLREEYAALIKQVTPDPFASVA